MREKCTYFFHIHMTYKTIEYARVKKERFDIINLQKKKLLDIIDYDGLHNRPIGMFLKF